MPTLVRLLEHGSWGKLNSTMPPWTPAAWSTIVTGKNPGKHGIFDLLWKRSGSYDFSPTNASHRIGRPFWKLLNDYGIKTGLVNVPFSYPPTPLDGFLVCGFGTPNMASEIAYPADVADWIKRNFEWFEPEVDAEFLATRTPKEIFSAERKQQETYVGIATALSNHYQIDVLVINLMFPDHANHKMPEMRQVEDAYIQTDTDLSKLIQAFVPDNIMLLSDHGSNRLKGDFLLDTWLRDHGYYTVLETSVTERASQVDWLLSKYFQEHLGWSGIIEKTIRYLLRLSILKFPGLFSTCVWNKIETVYPNAREYLLMSGRPDYATTIVFPGSVYSGLLYINVLDREENGVVPIEARREIADEITAKLHKVKDPKTGESIFSNVFFSEDLYSGLAAEHAPDLILDGYQMRWNIRMRKNYFPSPPRTIINKYFSTDTHGRDYGWHTREGIFVFYGKDFERSVEPLDAELADIPATLLHLYGVPIPEDYDGSVLTNIMIPELGARPIKYQPGDNDEPDERVYTDQETEALMDHLRALGYLD